MSVVPEPSMSARRTRRWSNWSACVEPRRVVHRDLGAEPAVAEVRPVADLAVADAHEVGQPVAGHVGEVDGLRAVGEARRAARVSSSSALPHVRGRPKPSSPSDGYQVNDVVLA